MVSRGWPALLKTRTALIIVVHETLGTEPSAPSCTAFSRRADSRDAHRECGARSWKSCVQPQAGSWKPPRHAHQAHQAHPAYLRIASSHQSAGTNIPFKRPYTYTKTDCNATSDPARRCGRPPCSSHASGWPSAPWHHRWRFHGPQRRRNALFSSSSRTEKPHARR